MWLNNKDAELERRAESVIDSALYRRRAKAIHILATARNRPAAQRVFLLVTVLLGFIVVGRTVLFKRMTSTQESKISLSQPTPIHKFDRFTISHTVRDGETIWGISLLYYRSYSNSNQKRLRDANPWLPEDPRQLKIGLTMKIPLI
jgi:hypothetical protein